MKYKTYNCTVQTPMFSDSITQHPEIRRTEIKAAMKFWWRAMHPELDIAELKRRESQIFGGKYIEDTKEKSCKSLIEIVEVVDNITPTKDWIPDSPDHFFTEINSKNKERVFNILAYLCYGRSKTVPNKKSKDGKPVKTEDCKPSYIYNYHLPASQSFSITFLYEDESHLELIKKLIWLTGNISGIGGRSRNGFGKFSVNDMESQNSVMQLDYVELLKDYAKDKELGSYTTFSKHLKLFATQNTYASWDLALAEIGKVYKRSRNEMGKTQIDENGDKYSGEKRKFLGLPLRVLDTNGRFKNLHIGNLKRHTKSYFLTVIKENDGDAPYRGAILFLPYNYLYECPAEITNPVKQPLLCKEYLKQTSDFNALLSNGLKTKI